MGLDTECDLTLQARGREDVSDAIRALRSQLLAEHLGCTPQQVQEAVAAAGSVRGAMAQLQREDRTLRPLTLPQVSETVLSVASVADPEKPVALSDLARLLESDSDARAERDDPARMPASPEPQEPRADPHRAPSWRRLALIVVGILALAATWKFTPLAGFLDGNRIVGWARRFGDQWWVPLATILAYTPAALTMFPRPLITLFAVIAFGPLMGFAYAMLGIELSAWVTFVAGRRLDRGTVQRVAGRKLSDILQVLRRRGLLAITALRLVPLAPFAVEGVVAGAARVKLWHFMVGTALGILPGTLTSTVFGDQLQTWLDDPRRINYWLIAAVLLVLGAATWGVQRWLASSLSRSRHGRHGVGDTGTG
jgi:phospholipase D1/2